MNTEVFFLIHSPFSRQGQCHNHLQKCAQRSVLYLNGLIADACKNENDLVTSVTKKTTIANHTEQKHIVSEGPFSPSFSFSFYNSVIFYNETQRLIAGFPYQRCNGP